ncbi:MAG: hypothetical protein HC831_30990 [Chloroflexia bacterium]|nr:hypothetical protein [Chloroflexia bacterium]
MYLYKIFYLCLRTNNVIKTIAKFPDHFSVDDLVDKMILLDKIEKGIQQADNNQTTSDEELDKKIEEWLK